ncbi:MAG TPA: hypothetical protein VFR86_27760 [Burkholderiaceae bacterium]|nr:hypothetical protein [Burkholderiaceae bacterium]
MTAATRPLQLALGLTVWSLWFVAAYGGLSLGCAFAPPPVEDGARTWINGALGVLTGATVALLLALAGSCRNAPRTAAAARCTTERFVATVAAGLHTAAAPATAFVGAPVIGLPPCL